MKLKILVCALAALLFFASSVSMILTGIRGVQQERIMSETRRNSRLVQKDTEPIYYWVNISYNGLGAMALLALGGWMVRLAMRRSPPAK